MAGGFDGGGGDGMSPSLRKALELLRLTRSELIAAVRHELETSASTPAEPAGKLVDPRRAPTPPA